MSKFNPTVSEFIESHKDLTIIGLFWAGYWRLMGVVYGIGFVVVIVIAGLGAIFS